MKKIAFYLFPDLLLLDVAGPMEVFSMANRYLKPSDHYQVTTVAFENRIVQASNGLTLQATQLLGEPADAPDLLLLPGGPGAYDRELGAAREPLRQACANAKRYGSICTGAFILGQLGLLEDRRVTTHWNYTQRLAALFPRARVESDEIFLSDDGLVTSGGVTAGIDLALALVAEDYGKPIAVEVAKVILVAARRQGGQARFSPLLREIGNSDSPIAKVHRYVLENPQEEFSNERLAAMASMSTRNFSRVFSRELQMTPTQFVQMARIDHARKLLESSNLPMKAVAHRSGLKSVKCLRQLFFEKLGISPAEYRQQFG